MPPWVSLTLHSRISGIQQATDGSDSHAGVLLLYCVCFIDVTAGARVLLQHIVYV